MRILGLPLNNEQQDEEMSEAGPSSKQPGVNIPDLVKTRVNIQFLELTRLFIPYLVLICFLHYFRLKFCLEYSSFMNLFYNYSNMAHF